MFCDERHDGETDCITLSSFKRQSYERLLWREKRKSLQVARSTSSSADVIVPLQSSAPCPLWKRKKQEKRAETLRSNQS